MDFDLGRGGLGRKFQVAGVADIGAPKDQPPRCQGGGGHPPCCESDPHVCTYRRGAGSAPAAPAPPGLTGSAAAAQTPHSPRRRAAEAGATQRVGGTSGRGSARRGRGCRAATSRARGSALAPTTRRCVPCVRCGGPAAARRRSAAAACARRARPLTGRGAGTLLHRRTRGGSGGGVGGETTQTPSERRGPSTRAGERR